MGSFNLDLIFLLILTMKPLIPMHLTYNTHIIPIIIWKFFLSHWSLGHFSLKNTCAFILIQLHFAGVCSSPIAEDITAYKLWPTKVLWFYFSPSPPLHPHTTCHQAEPGKCHRVPERLDFCRTPGDGLAVGKELKVGRHQGSMSSNYYHVPGE